MTYQLLQYLVSTAVPSDILEQINTNQGSWMWKIYSRFSAENFWKEASVVSSRIISLKGLKIPAKFTFCFWMIRQGKDSQRLWTDGNFNKCLSIHVLLSFLSIRFVIFHNLAHPLAVLKNFRKSFLAWHTAESLQLESLTSHLHSMSSLGITSKWHCHSLAHIFFLQGLQLPTNSYPLPFIITTWVCFTFKRLHQCLCDCHIIQAKYQSYSQNGPVKRSTNEICAGTWDGNDGGHVQQVRHTKSVNANRLSTSTLQFFMSLSR